jgi:putative ABC transport system permease protein
MLEELKYSLRNLTHRKLRSFLTVLSILIGITAIFALVSFGLGINNYIDNLAQESGIDKMFIQAKGTGAPGTDSNFYISEDDIDYVSKINGVNEITGLYMNVAELKYRNDNNYYFVMGLDPDKIKLLDETFTVSVEYGRHLKDGDMNKVVLGYNYMRDDIILNHGIKLGDKVLLNNIEFDVVGFYEEIGNPGDDAQMYVTDEAFETLLYPDSKNKYGFAILRSDSNTKSSEIAEKITEKLRKHKGQEEGEETFYVQTFEDAIATFTNITDILNGILILIAFISLIVASINIMNTMYTAVLERTKEIGVMKSIGAKNKSILMIFILESGFLGLVGGILGVFFGWIIATMGGKIAADSGYSLLQPYFPWYLIVGCLLFAFLVGTIAGFFPAKQASKLKPVDALRYE